jgi:RimJ/RimL family protein N-acetyltransferase
MPNDLHWPRRTARLELRQPAPADFDDVLAIRNDPELNRWFIRTSVEPESFRKDWLESVDDPDAYAVVAIADGVLVGTGSLDVSDGMGQGWGREDAESFPWHRSEGMLGYMIVKEHAGQGYATEIVRDLLALAFEDLGLHRVTAGCFADNVGSWRVMEKVGMRREQHGVQDSWHEELGWVDGYTYGILAEEWGPAASAG